MTKKVRNFINEYLLDLNATQAAVRAGYSAHSARAIGSKLLTKADVQEAISMAIKERAKRCEVTADMVIAELKKIAFANFGSLASWNPSGIEIKSSSELMPDELASIQSVEEHTNQHGGSLKIKQHDKIRALELLARHLGLLDDRLKLSADNEIRVIVENYKK